MTPRIYIKINQYIYYTDGIRFAQETAEKLVQKRKIVTQDES
jgi:hypothetical protein